MTGPSVDRLAPVGVFDSGVGGLTVARAIIDQLPDENMIYVGDTANGPYGPLPLAQIRTHALAIMDDLVDRGVKALVIACNTASSACLRDARERYDVPVVEVILPAVRRAVAATRNGHIGVIGTQATITSRAYQDAFAAARDTEIAAVACPGSSTSWSGVSPAGVRSSGWRRRTWNRCSAPGSTRWCWAVRTTRCCPD